MGAVVIAMRVIPRPLMTKDKKVVTLHRDNWRAVYQTFAMQYRSFSVSSTLAFFYLDFHLLHIGVGWQGHRNSLR